MAKTILYAEGVVLTIVKDPITRDAVGQGFTDFMKLSPRGARAWIFDASSVTQVPGQDVLDKLASVLTEAKRLAGLRGAWVVSTNPAVKLGAQMLSFRAGVPCSVAPTVSEAATQTKGS